MRTVILSLRWLVLLSLVGGALLIYKAPADSFMGVSQKIMYVHVPSILVAYLAIFGVLLGSVYFLWKASPLADMLALACAELGALFGAVNLLSGALWGKPVWGTYWVWDARLTLSLIMFLIFAGYALLRALGTPNLKTAKTAAVVGILGFLVVPLNHLAVHWWRTLHQPSTMFSSQNTMSPEIRNVLLISLGIALLLFVHLLLERLHLERQKRVLLFGVGRP